MSGRVRNARTVEQLEEYRSASGWYLAAWRDFRGLTLESLASELGSTKGYVSDLETGVRRNGRPATRYNRDLVDSISALLGITGGHLLDLNPYRERDDKMKLTDMMASMAPANIKALIQISKVLDETYSKG